MKLSLTLRDTRIPAIYNNTTQYKNMNINPHEAVLFLNTRQGCSISNMNFPSNAFLDVPVIFCLEDIFLKFSSCAFLDVQAIFYLED
ncbi:hypothetical protein L9F63_013704, partial [Diploptera punctata]